LFAAALAAAVLMPPAFAQEAPGGQMPLTDATAYPHRPTPPTIQEYFEHHPEVADALRRSPSMLYDPEFLKTHPDVQRYFRDHPEATAEAKRNPASTLDRMMNHSHGKITNLQDYLGNHPDIAQQLRKRPALIDDPDFERAHPDLGRYAKEHPEECQELKQNPDRFIHEDFKG
jgi:2-oxo-4-hydroxy-4-carboxy--5-ureidoimidazoline (OHCU) decarboxylase